MKNIIITGATGFVGKNLSKYLLEESFQVKTYIRNNALNLADLPPKNWSNLK